MSRTKYTNLSLLSSFFFAPRFCEVSNSKLQVSSLSHFVVTPASFRPTQGLARAFFFLCLVLVLVERKALYKITKIVRAL